MVFNLSCNILSFFKGMQKFLLLSLNIWFLVLILSPYMNVETINIISERFILKSIRHKKKLIYYIFIPLNVENIIF